MAVQYGKCTNRAGCTLAYTGDQIRFEGAPICPECGQPLAVIKASGGGGGKLWLLILLFVVLIAMVAAGYFIVQAALTWNTKPTPSPTASPTPSVTVSPSTSPSPTVTVSASPSTTATPTPEPSSPSASPSPSASDSGSGGSLDKKPENLSKSDTEKTRQEVIERIKVTPRMSQSEKDKLQDKVQSAVSMERLQVVHFDVGRSMVGKQVIDDLTSTFSSSEMKEKMSDPTLVFVVAGYADKGGNPSANLRLSDDRAQNIAHIMKAAGVTNVIHTVAMGATELLGRPDQNRAVEIWAVIP